MKAVLCPVCSGKGTTRSTDPIETGASYPCHGCSGLGWVSVAADKPDEPNIPLDPTLVKFYEKKGYNVCPTCGGDRNSSPGTGCPLGSHYGTYSEEV